MELLCTLDRERILFYLSGSGALKTNDGQLIFKGSRTEILPSTIKILPLANYTKIR